MLWISSEYTTETKETAPHLPSNPSIYEGLCTNHTTPLIPENWNEGTSLPAYQIYSDQFAMYSSITSCCWIIQSRQDGEAAYMEPLSESQDDHTAADAASQPQGGPSHCSFWNTLELRQKQGHISTVLDESNWVIFSFKCVFYYCEMVQHHVSIRRPFCLIKFLPLQMKTWKARNILCIISVFYDISLSAFKRRYW